MATQMENMRLRQNFRNIWHTDLITSNQNHIRYCCFAFWCAPCVSYMLRKRALYDDMSRYTCCAGYMPCSGRCEESKYPELCLATEGFISYTQQLGCVFSMIGLIVPNNRPLQKASEVLFFLANLVYCTIYMQTQHKLQLDHRDDENGGPMDAPRPQQMSTFDSSLPPLYAQS
ncbi:uncharacterized protein [Phaseolus vulgaris]|uniref:uncharacterized protein isoform X6 n=1 Tax=Phaseolus vulgaris TaxID=3885 RepID=UPI0035CB25EE